MSVFPKRLLRVGLFYVIFSLMLAALGSMASAAPQTLTILGAYGTRGDIDPYTEVSHDDGATWGPAYLYGWHPWGFVSGTNSWINCGPDGERYCLYATVLYRVRFNVPEGATNPQMVFDVKADNYATIWVNGAHVADIVGAGNTTTDATIASTIVPGTNEVLLKIRDEGGWAGFNYKITLTMDAPTAPTTISLAPAISDIPNQSTAEDTPIGLISFTVDDADTPAGNLTVTAVSSDQSLLPNANITVGGSDANRTISLNPSPDQSGTATVTVTVSDGSLTASDTFTLTVTPVDDPPSLSVGGTSTYTENDQAVPVAPGLTVADSDGGNVPGARVAIGTGFVPAEDRLGIVGQAGTSGSVNGLSWNYNTTTGIMSLTGSASAATYQQALSQVAYSNLSENPGIVPRTVGFSLGNNSLYLPATGHFYEYVPGSINWNVARARAEDTANYGQPGYPSGVFGLQGYLATITSQAENQFAASKLQGDGWIGASDQESEGTWKWVTGPEAGTIFSAQYKTGWCSAYQAPGVNGQYANWNPGEPNDCGSGEDVAHFYAGSGTWNDFPADANVAGYVVEYGGMAGDLVLTLTGSAQVNVVAVNDAPTISAFADHTLQEGAPAVTVPYTIGDVDNSVAQLTVSVQNSNPSKVTAVLGGTGSNRTITVTGMDDVLNSDVTILVSDGSAQSTQTFKVTVNNAAPTVTAAGDQTANEGDTASFSLGSFTDPGPDAPWSVTVNWGDGTPDATFTASDAGTLGSQVHTYGDNGSYTVTVTVTDKDGASNAGTFQVAVANVAPAVTAAGDQTANEGDTASFSLGSFTDPGPDAPWSVTVNWGDGTPDTTFTASDAGTLGSQVHTYGDNGSYTVTVTVTDKEGASDTNTFLVAVANVAPALGSITGPVDPQLYTNSVSISASFTDPGVMDTHTVSVDWGDGSVASGTVSLGSANGSHVYNQAGVFTVTMTVTDKDNGVSNTQIFQYVVVYNPDGGFVTGGGWINSPAGAYASDPALTGKANFGFVSKYKKGATIPTGQTQFQFKAGNLNFHSSAYDWLVIAGARAQYKGTGTINGSGEYKFILTAIDGQVNGGGGVDKFRIKIWNDAGVVYDNMMNAAEDAEPTTAIGGGSIVIHSK